MAEHLNAEEIKAFQALLSKDEGRSEMVQLFKLLGDATRLNIITLLTQREPLCVEDLMNCTGMEQSAISHQLRILKQNKLVKSRREGKSIFYSLADDHVRTIINQGREHIEED